VNCLSLSNSWVTHSIPLFTLSSPFLAHLCAITFRMSHTLEPRFTNAPVHEQIFRAKTSRMTNCASDYEHASWQQRQSWEYRRGIVSCSLTLSLLTYVYRAPCKARNFNVVYILTYVWQRWKPSLSICCIMFHHWINTESYPVAQLCVNTLLSTKVTLITDGI
jgi:hypothetical protein